MSSNCRRASSIRSNANKNIPWMKLGLRAHGSCSTSDRSSSLHARSSASAPGRARSRPAGRGSLRAPHGFPNARPALRLRGRAAMRRPNGHSSPPSSTEKRGSRAQLEILLGLGESMFEQRYRAGLSFTVYARRPAPARARPRPEARDQLLEQLTRTGEHPRPRGGTAPPPARVARDRPLALSRSDGCMLGELGRDLGVSKLRRVVALASSVEATASSGSRVPRAR